MIILSGFRHFLNSSLYNFIIFSESCSQTFTSSTGTITSPNYPEIYNNSLNCVSNIMVNGASAILLTLHDFQYECHYDWLKIYSGSDLESSNLLYDRYVANRYGNIHTFSKRFGSSY